VPRQKSFESSAPRDARVLDREINIVTESFSDRAHAMPCETEVIPDG
jgi:hypothetical protein